MKLTTTTTSLALLAAAITTASAQPYSETNAQRMKRGLGPNPPVRRAPTAVAGARRTNPSSTPGQQCNTGPVQCCNSVGRADSGIFAILLGLLGIQISDPSTIIGATCSPISVIGGGSTSCSSQPVCCSNNSFNGIIAVGCSPSKIPTHLPVVPLSIELTMAPS
ncbi:hypothetical protein D9619_009917 [Psilocybe cf. subviscida]|uniref:Hydrophobin n=1 Tax=Psilocybe cf. subviscida TaxID=2480587 RepID=A0A8H5BLL3_9AGAR|nr:hypothetical protein D9619_009917 [Psilocybe cf. subviscida]